MTGTQIDQQKGLEQLQKTALHGYYLEPFAKLLLAVAALRDNQKDKAREILSELHTRFPNNQLYGRELARLGPTTARSPALPNDSK
jgi:predicted Zn-dependent protease